MPRTDDHPLAPRKAARLSAPKAGPSDREAREIEWNTLDATRLVAAIAAFWAGVVFLFRYALGWALDEFGPIPAILVFAVGALALGYLAVFILRLLRRALSRRTHTRKTNT